MQQHTWLFALTHSNQRCIVHSGLCSTWHTYHMASSSCHDHTQVCPCTTPCGTSQQLVVLQRAGAHRWVPQAHPHTPRVLPGPVSQPQTYTLLQAAPAPYLQLAVAMGHVHGSCSRLAARAQHVKECFAVALVNTSTSHDQGLDPTQHSQQSSLSAKCFMRVSAGCTLCVSATSATRQYLRNQQQGRLCC